MKLKRIDVTGFKSFMDRATIEFDNGITAIVGPNGCGKSNVVDAIRWCMGEQSAKHLRGKSMDDVIFSGSESHSPLSVAEVEMTFVNDGHGVPPQYQAFSEITIGRKLYRDGQSDYVINKTPCRLLDVTEFFLGTGVGTKAYSIIEQGRVGLIVSSKPEDRRLIIEEAAGITKYRARKRAALRKMEHTHNNLQRVADIVREIEGRLDSLERQAKKAERYKAYKDELRGLDLGIHAWQYAALAAETAAKDAELLAVREREAGVAAAYEATEAELAAARLQAAEHETALRDLTERLHAATQEVRVTETAIEHEGREIDAARERREHHAGEIRDIDGTADDTAAELAVARQQLASLEGLAATDTQELEAATTAYASLRDKLARVGSERDHAKARIVQCLTQEAQHKTNLDNFRRRRHELENRKRDLAEELERARALGAQTEAELAACIAQLEERRRGRMQLQDDHNLAVRELHQLKTAYLENEAHAIALREDMAAAKARLASLVEIQQRFEGYQAGVREIMLAARSRPGFAGVKGIVADVIEAAKGFEAAIEAVLGERIQYILADSFDTATAGIEYLKTSGEGRGTFLALDVARAPGAAVALPGEGVLGPALAFVKTGPDFESAVAALLGDTYVVADLDRARALFAAGTAPGAVLVTQAGEVLWPAGAVSGGSAASLEKGLLQRKAEIRELEEQCTALVREHDAARARHDELKTGIAAAEGTLEKIRQTTHSAELTIIGEERDVQKHEAELKRLSDRAGILEYEIEQAGGQGRELATAEEETVAAITASEATRQEAERGAGELTAQGGALEGELAALNEAIQSLRARKAAADARREALAQQTASLAARQDDLAARRARATRLVEEARETEERLTASIGALREKLHAARDTAAKWEAELAQARRVESDLVDRIAGLEAAVKAARLDRDGAAQQIGSLTLRLQELRMNVERLMSQALERYEADLTVAPVPETEPAPEAAERVDELRRLIGRMGEINLTAITEFQELQGRHEFLQKQHQDLTDALDRLQRAINKINRTSRERFKATFAAVNEKFQELFPKLFRGGSASLVLTESEDILEAGVDIVAQPPGKRLGSLDLMSGGEKALTAVSLIFSIFLIKPSPFCLLDEVDAPLDDANIGRFNEIVLEMAKHSQFILITHNKRTMEIADTLYGVTMQEPGVSKLVSVHISVNEHAAVAVAAR